MLVGGPNRIHISPPDITESEVDAVVSALRSGWIAPLGPDVDAFESEVATFCGVEHAVAVSSGTAALHLGLLGLGVTAQDEVVVPTMTFGATAFAVTYVGALPAFLDIEPQSWNLDPDVLESFLFTRASLNLLPAAIITVDVFGRSCDYERIIAVANRYEVPVLADSAESLGATYGGQACGSFGQASVISFNGNKIMTTSGGGMLLTNDALMAAKSRFWSAQSREPAPWYEHLEVGYNYRLSNILAALGRAQLTRLPAMIERRRAIRDLYAVLLGGIPGVSVLGDPPWGRSNAWLTTVLFDPVLHADAPRRVRETLETFNIESRPVWKPMHQQPVFASNYKSLTGVADKVFNQGLCLPSGATLSDDDLIRISGIVSSCLNQS